VAPDLADALCDDLDGWLAGALELAGAWTPDVTADTRHTVFASTYARLAARLGEVAADAIGAEAADVVWRVARLPGLTGALVDELAGRADGAELLDGLAGAGLVAEGRPRHPGLVEVHPLLRIAAAEPSEEVLVRAAGWYLEHRQPLAAAWCHRDRGDWDAVASALLDNLFDLLNTDRLPELARLVRSLPPEVMAERYMWGIGIAAIVRTSGDGAGTLAVLDAIGPGTTLAHRIVGAHVRSCVIPHLEDPTPCLEAAELVLQLCDEAGDDHVFDDLYTTSRTRHWRVQARATALYAGAVLGEWDRVARYTEPVDAASMVEIPPPLGLIPLLGRRAAYFALGGWLGEAERDAQAAVELDGSPNVEEQTVESQLALGEVRRARGQRVEALATLAEVVEVALATNRPTTATNAAAGLALLHLDAADPDAAEAVLARARALGFRPAPTLQGRLAAAAALAAHRRGDPDAAAGWLDRAPHTADTAAAAVQIALERGDAAGARRTLEGWPSTPTLRSRVARAAADALVREVTGDRSGAVDLLRGALADAADDVLVQSIAQFAVLGLGPLRALLADPVPAVASMAAATFDVVNPTGPLSLLTDGERRLLHHLAVDVTLPTLADRLLVSQNTLHSQARSLYRKLGTSTRADAVAHLSVTGRHPHATPTRAG
jgi:ATP/maltotriose-dependent transcriptional regulator MalT